MKLKKETGVYFDVPNDEYHADRTMVSNSWLKRVNQSPFHLWQYLNEPYERTDALIIGSAVDCLIFEPEKFDSQFVQGINESKSTIKGKEAWAAFYESVGTRDILTVHTSVNYWDQVHQTAEAARSNPLMKDLLEHGMSQVVFVAQDEVTGLWCKAKADWWISSENRLVDLKTAVSASPYKFSKAIADFRYHVQDAFYATIVQKAAQVTELPDFIFAVMEKPAGDRAPDSRLMAFYQLTPEERLAGISSFESDLAAIAFAIDNNEWAGYADRVIPIERPRYAQSQDE